MIENCAIETRARGGHDTHNLAKKALHIESDHNITRSDFRALENRLENLQKMMSRMSTSGFLPAPQALSAEGSVMHAASDASSMASSQIEPNADPFLEPSEELYESFEL
eukprot:5425402-Amphidinium_carterae.1